MALTFSQLCFSSSKLTTNNPPKLFKITPKPTLIFSKRRPTKITMKFSTIPNSSKEEDNTNEEDNPAAETAKKESVEMTELGMEIKKAMEEKKEPGFFDGVAEEIKEIEWPAFSKVLATTGVVIGVIAGSSVVLLTVNAVLAEISDGIFAGKGVQDFFG